VINGTPRVVHEKKLSHENVVDLAYDGNPPTGPSVMIVVTYARGESSQKGTLVAGQEVPVHKGMVFNVYDATES
jgi:Multiubiquitin